MSEGGTDEIAIGARRYRWELVDPPDLTSSLWAHPGVCVADDGSVLWTALDGATILSAAEDGTVRRISVDATECHALATDRRGGVWIADPGRKALADGPAARRVERPGRVLRIDGAGVVTRTLDCPTSEPWRPSGIALHAGSAEGDERIWVADGYGQSMVHAFAPDGRRLWTVDRAAGIELRTPHGIVVDDRGTEPRVLVADRGNQRIVVLSLDGDDLGALALPELTSPSGFALDGPRLWVTELFGALRVIGPHDELVASVGDASAPVDPVWPNALRDGRLSAPDLQDRVLHAPHGIGATPGGVIYITEWVVGGRMSRLVPLTSSTDDPSANLDD